MSAESPSAGSPKLAGGYKIYIFTGGTGTVTI
jgi:altronate dehydratase